MYNLEFLLSTDFLLSCIISSLNLRITHFISFVSLTHCLSRSLTLGLRKMPYIYEILSKAFSCSIVKLDYSEHMDLNQFKAARCALVSFLSTYMF